MNDKELDGHLCSVEYNLDRIIERLDRLPFEPIDEADAAEVRDRLRELIKLIVDDKASRNDPHDRAL